MILKSEFNTVNFELFSYQERLYHHLEDHPFTIFSKFRGGGFFTFFIYYSIWLCLFREHQQVLWLTLDAVGIARHSRTLKQAIERLPSWLTGNVMKMTNDREKHFQDTDSYITFCPHTTATPIRSTTFCLIEEASYMDLGKFWKAFYPALADSRCCVYSTVRNDEDWFWNTLWNTRYGITNLFSEYRCKWQENPLLTEDWAKDMMSNIGTESWKQSFEQIPVERSPDEKNIFVSEKKAIQRRYRYIDEE